MIMQVAKPPKTVQKAKSPKSPKRPKSPKGPKGPKGPRDEAKLIGKECFSEVLPVHCPSCSLDQKSLLGHSMVLCMLAKQSLCLLL